MKILFILFALLASIFFSFLGCGNDGTSSNLCEGVTCDVAPQDICMDASTLRKYQAPGTCKDGECDYPYTDSTCDLGCEDNACKTPGECDDDDGDGYGIGKDCLGADCDDTSDKCTTQCVDVDKDGIFDCKDDCIDIDGDQYGTGTGCQGEDCDETSALCNVDCTTDANQNQLRDCDEGCEDKDGDGYGTGTKCLGADCDDQAIKCTTDCVTDTDEDGIPNCKDGCLDRDGDGYGQGTDCLGLDCDDNDGDNWVHCADCKDTDQDEYFVGCDQYQSHLGPDCDDSTKTCTNNCTADIDQDAIADCKDSCIDADKDQYGTGTSCLGEDCDDTASTCTTACSDSDQDNVFDCKDGCIDVDGDNYGIGAECTGVDCDDNAALCNVDCTTDANNNNHRDCDEDCEDPDHDGYGTGSNCLGPDCDESSINCNTDCNTDVDQDGISDCKDKCIDVDKDGYGQGLDCTGVDCSDSDIDNWNMCATCKDSDTDTYFIDCNQYINRKGPDCSDSDIDNWDKCGTCKDADTDTYYAGCNQYINHKGPDCSDSDIDNWNMCATCKDADTDTYFIDCNQYTNHKGPDCSDSDIDNWDKCGTCKDSDTDTYFIDCNQYINRKGPDCSDSDIDNWNKCTTCLDADGDTYFGGCNQYINHKGPDCDDTIYRCNTDCTDNNANQIPDCGETWMLTLGGPGCDDAGISVIEIKDKDLIVVGKTSCYGGDFEDMWVMKLDRVGNVLWQQTIGKPGPMIQSTPSSVMQASDGGIVVIGYTLDLMSSTAPYEDIWVLKLDPTDGHVLWQKTVGGAKGDFPASVLETDNGYLLIAGSTQSFGVATNEAFFLVVNKDTGALAKAFTVGGIAGNSYQVSQIVKSISLSATEMGFVAVGSTNHQDLQLADMWIFRLQIKNDFSAITIPWSRRISSGNEWGVSIAEISASPKKFLAGGFTDSGFYGKYDMFLAIIEDLGATSMLHWTGVIGSPLDDRLFSIAQVGTNSMTVVGDTYSAISLNLDLYLAQLSINADGPPTIEWQERLGTAYTDWLPGSVISTSESGIVLLGSTQYPGGLTDDLLIAKLDGKGSIYGNCGKLLNADLQAVSLMTIPQSVTESTHIETLSPADIAVSPEKTESKPVFLCPE